MRRESVEHGLAEREAHLVHLRGLAAIVPVARSAIAR
jgi:hypothetical protein